MRLFGTTPVDCPSLRLAVLSALQNSAPGGSLALTPNVRLVSKKVAVNVAVKEDKPQKVIRNQAASTTSCDSFWR